ncbi:MAG: enoyl-CoA hydratase/isomerase family protein [Asticcacaulis sp.]|nr:enoyl-CoA hydratase/isomerase family protein [Asticcacaulis sp.]
MIRRDDGLLWLKLNRPAKKNALTRAMYAALADALTEADDDDSVRAAVITAEGADFCAGNDIFDFAQDVPALMADGIDPDAMPVFRFLKALTFFSKPLVAGLQGQAVGVGVTLLLHCDLVVAGEDIRLRLPFLHLGLVPEAGSSLLLPRRIGHARAFEWLSQNLAVDAATARDWGLVNRVVPVAEVEAEAEAMARSLVRLPPTAVRETKRLMRDPDALWPVVEAEGRIFRRLLTSPEAQAAFAAFLKR